eukprot:GHVS01058278.1.p1 GENE.GHVS01058278.1~~GHVS01058278.1.p1  ORF type:complete len:373 (-),score=51.92 GHVS01058278.1:421-1539(-)
MSPDVPRRAAKGIDVKLRGEDDEAIVWFHRVLPRIKSTYFASNQQQFDKQPNTLSCGRIPVDNNVKTTDNDSQHQGYRIIECLQKAGDVIFVPPGWWHAVVNIEDTIACTQNYVSYANFDAAWCSMRRGRPRLATLWYRRLKSFYPDLHRRVGFLNTRDSWGIANCKFKKIATDIGGGSASLSQYARSKEQDCSGATQWHEDGSSSDSSSSSSSSSSDDDDEMQEIASQVSRRMGSVELANLEKIQYFDYVRRHDEETPAVDNWRMNRLSGGEGKDEGDRASNGEYRSTMANWRKTTNRETNGASNVQSPPDYKRRCTDTSPPGNDQTNSSANHVSHAFSNNATTETNMCQGASVRPLGATVCDIGLQYCND